MKPLAEMSLPELIVFLHEWLDDKGVQHVFSGALALAYHVANPRATNDIDVALGANQSEARAVFEALPSGVTWSARQLRVAEVMGSVRLRWARDIPLDLFFPTDDHHRVMVARAIKFRFQDADLPFVTATDLTVLKATFDRGTNIAGKEQDWVDIRRMLEAGKVNVREVQNWLRQKPNATAALQRFDGLVAEGRGTKRKEQQAGAIGMDISSVQPSSVGSRHSERCGYWMPKAMRHCSRPANHKGQHH